MKKRGKKSGPDKGNNPWIKIQRYGPHLEGVMVNIMYELNWAMGYPDLLFLDVSVSGFLDGINTELVGRVKQIASPVWVGLIKSMKAWIEWEPSLSTLLSWSGERVFQAWTWTETMSWVLLGLDFSVSIIMWVNSLFKNPFWISVLFLWRALTDTEVILVGVGVWEWHALEKEMATHSSVLAWRIPGMGEPGGLPSMGLHRVGHNWSDLAAAAGEKSETMRLRQVGDRVKRTRDHWAVIAYSNWCRICDLQRFIFRTGDQDWLLKSFCVAEFH